VNPIDRSLVRTGRLAGYVVSRRLGRLHPMPLNLTASVTRRCDSRCRTCGIWCADEGAIADELSLGEWTRLFESIGPGRVYFLNISGGEPTLRDDLPDIVRAGARLLEAPHVHLPTNGIDPDRILRVVERLLDALDDTGAVLSVKPSLDGIGEDHDRIRGVEGNWRGVRETIDRLIALRAARRGRLEVGVGTVVSRLNWDRTDAIVRFAGSLELDSVIHEIAEEREEMDNDGRSITPDDRQYGIATRPFARALARQLRHGRPEAVLRAALRLRMIDLTLRWLRTGRQPLPCYAGITNAHVGPRGGLWACAVRARTHRMAGLRDHGMSLPSAWRSDGAARVRRTIREGGCDCPLANQLYANILLDPVEMARAAALVARARGGA